MQLRIYVMYGKSRRILAILSVTTLSVFATVLAIIVNLMNHEFGLSSFCPGTQEGLI